jgi:hypothetical protein
MHKASQVTMLPQEYETIPGLALIKGLERDLR